jgi:polysaccharide deacetylase 2 family uncharacterized protein YibQ
MRALWIATATLSVLATAAFLALFLRDHYASSSMAIAKAVRVEVNLKTGEIKQAPEVPEPVAAPAAAEVKPEAPAPEKAEEKKEEPKPEEHKDGKEEPKAKEEHKDTKDEHKDAKEEHKEKGEPKPTKEDPKAAKEEHKNVKEEAKKEENKEEPKEKAKEPTEKAEPKEKKAAVELPKGPRIAIVISGMGLSRSSTEQVFKLPATISFSFSPYASELAKWIKKAEGDKHELYVDIPLEPKDYPHSDPGPYALLLNLGDEKNMERLNQVLKKGEGYQGVVTGPDEHFTQNSRAYEWLMNAVKAKKMTFFYAARPENKLLTQEIEKSKRTEAVGIDIVLDEKLTNEAIDAQLAQAEVLAQKYGFATVLARPYPISAQRIQEWIKTLGPKNIHLVPLSQAKAQ